LGKSSSDDAKKDAKELHKKALKLQH